MSYPAPIPYEVHWFEPDPSALVVSWEGSTTGLVAEKLEELRKHFKFPATRQAITIAERFRELAPRWRAETEHLSSTTAIATHPAYQEIIGLGPEVIPLILGQLEREPAPWFWALRALTGVDPVPPDQRGRVRPMIDAWLAWGRSRGYRW